MQSHTAPGFIAPQTTLTALFTLYHWCNHTQLPVLSRLRRHWQLYSLYTTDAITHSSRSYRASDDIDSSIHSIPLMQSHTAPGFIAPQTTLTALFNMRMSTCGLPDDWKHAFVVPIHKKEDKCKNNNYRPISLLNGVSKIMERLVFNHVYPFVYPIVAAPKKQQRQDGVDVRFTRELQYNNP